MATWQKVGKRINGWGHRLQHDVIAWVLLAFIVIIPLTSPERNILIRQAVMPVLLMRLVAMVILGLWILSVLMQRKINLKLPWVLLPVVAFILTGILADSLAGVSHISLFGDSKAAFRGIFFSLSLLVFVLAAYNFIVRSNLARLAYGVSFSASTVSILGILQYFGIAPFLYQSLRAYSTLINPLELAGFLILVVPVLIVNFLSHSDASRQTIPGATRQYPLVLVVNAMAIILAILCLLLTSSRAGILALVLSVVIFLLGYPVKQTMKLIPIAGIIIFIYAAIMLVPVSVRGMSAAFSPPTDTLDTASPSLVSRLSTWRIGLKMFAKKPVLGWGDADLANKFRGQEDLLFTEQVGSDFTPFDLHNRFVTTLVENGIIGLAIFLLVIIHLFWSSRSLFWIPPGKMQDENRSGIDEYRRAMLFGLLALLLHWQLAPSWVATELLFWIFVAIVHGTREGNQRIINFEWSLLPRLTTVLSIILIAVAGMVVIWSIHSVSSTVRAEHLATSGIGMAAHSYYDQAAANVKDAIVLNSQEADYYGRLGYIYYIQGKAEKSQKILEKSIAVYKKAIAMNPDDPFRYERLVMVYQSLEQVTHGGYKDELFEWTKIAAGKNPSSIFLKRLLVKSYINKGERNKGMGMLKKLQTVE